VKHCGRSLYLETSSPTNSKTNRKISKEKKEKLMNVG